MKRRNLKNSRSRSCFFILFTSVMLPTFCSDLSSDKAIYNGEFLTLMGNVLLEHEMGHMEAHQAILKKGNSSQGLSTIQLEEEVSISFQNQDSLNSEYAFLDFELGEGRIASDTHPVVYRGQEVTLYSPIIDFTFSPSYEMTSMRAKEEVHIDYQKDFQLDCQEALFNQNSLKGTLTASKACHLTYFDNYIDASSMTLDLATDFITMELPRGTLSSLFFPNDSQRACQFTSDLLTWDPSQELLTLQGNIEIYDPSLGKLTGEEMFSLRQKICFRKRVIQSLETVGKTLFEGVDQQKLTTYGTLKMDRDHLVMTCTNPPDKQLVYETATLHLSADRGSIEYAFQGFDLKLYEIQLHGNVQILSQGFLRRGIADQIIHYPDRQETHLLANAGNHVLFWDDKQNLTLSAPEILIVTDPKSGEEIIKGLGTVRFVFNEEEGKRFEQMLYRNGFKK